MTWVGLPFSGYHRTFSATGEVSTKKGCIFSAYPAFAGSHTYPISYNYYNRIMFFVKVDIDMNPKYNCNLETTRS